MYTQGEPQLSIRINTTTIHPIPLLDFECSCPFDGVPTFFFLDYRDLQVITIHIIIQKKIFCFDLYFTLHVYMSGQKSLNAD